MWGCRVIVPEKFKKAILQQLHSNHIGATNMKSFARSYFWWPHLDRDIEQTATACEICCQFRPTPPKAMLQPWPWPKQPWTRIHVDFLGPIQKTINFFVIMDATSKWIEAFQVPALTAACAIDKLIEVFGRFGLPRSLTSDGAKCFVGNEFSEFLDKLNIIQHMVWASFHPQSNGAAESAVKIGKRCVLKTMANSQKTSLSQALNRFLLQYRNRAPSYWWTSFTVTSTPKGANYLWSAKTISWRTRGRPSREDEDSWRPKTWNIQRTWVGLG